MADINVTEEIIDINVTEEVIRIEAPAGAYPLTGYVPYIGALDDVDLGTHDLKTNKVFLLDEANDNYGSIHYSDGDFHIEDADGHKLLVVEDGFMQLHLTDTIQSNLFTTLLTQTRDHYLPNASGTLALTSQIPTNPVGGTGTTNTLPKFTGANTIGNSNISDSGSVITLGSDFTNINGFTSGGFTKVLPAGNTFGGLANGSTGNFTGSANGWGIISRQTWNINDDAFTFNGFTANDTRIVVNRSATSANGYTAFQGLIQNSGSATQGSAFGIYIANTSGNGNFGSVIAYKVGAAGTPSNTGTYTNYWAFQSNFLPLNIANFYGLEINDYTATTLARALNLNMAAGANKWNIYAGGTASNYLAGSLSIGSTSLTGINLFVAKNITGAAAAYGVIQQGVVQSDVTTSGYGFYNQLNTQAASFTTNYSHFLAVQNSIGAGSVITTQVAYNVASNLTSATNNYGFRGQIPVGTNRWNLFMDGMADNYLAGNTGIGTTTLGTATQLTIGGTETAVSAIARGQLINSTLVASAGGDTLVGLDINPTYNTGAFTGINTIGLRITGPTIINTSLIGSNQFNRGLRLVSTSAFNEIFFNVNNASLNDDGQFAFGVQNATNGFAYLINRMNSHILFGTNNATKMQLFNTGSVVLQNGGTFTDAGFRLDVNGTTRFIGTASSDTAPLGSELAAVTGTGTNWTLAGTNLNVGGYTHTVGSVDPLTTALAAVNGTYYQIAYTITGRTTGSITINYGGAAVGGLTATGTTGPLASSTAVLTITPTTDFNGTVVLSIKTIGTSLPSSTFSTSASTSNIEVRASSSSNNTFIGLQTGRRNTTGTSNTFIGVIAGRENTTGSDNTFIGAGSGQVNTIAVANTFVGANTGASNTGTSNSFFGTNSGLFNTTGSENTFLGRSAGQNNTTGTLNTFVGRQSGLGNTTAANNTAIGQSTLLNNTTQSGLTAIGASALQTNSTGSLNSAVGFAALRQNTTGSNNTAFGYATMQNNTTGSSNVAIGTNAGRYIANGSTDATIISNSIFIGSQAYPLADSQSNQIVIGSGTIGLGSNTTVIGNSSTTITGLYGNIRLVSGMGTAPASATATGTTGDIVVTAGFIYVCTATNTWVRTALTTW